MCQVLYINVLPTSLSSCKNPEALLFYDITYRYLRYDVCYCLISRLCTITLVLVSKSQGVCEARK